MPDPGISVLLPCRDAAAFLPECIRSLESQSDPDFEVVAVDDGSRDATAQLLSDWAGRDPRVRLGSATGSGLVPALRQAAARARAPLLARMDADDIAHPDRLAAQRALLSSNPRLAGCGTQVEYFPRSALGSGYLRYERWINSLSEPEDLERDLFVECPVAHPTLMLRAADYRAVGGYRDRGWPEDYDLVLRLLAAGSRLANVPRRMLRWRVSPGRLSMTSPGYAADAFQRCKAHHLSRRFLTPARPLVVWGAGRVGKGLARALLEHGRKLTAFVDLDPRKIGQQIHGAQVISPDALPGVGPRPYVLIAVGSPGARDEIRDALAEVEFRELDDYRALA